MMKVKEVYSAPHGHWVGDGFPVRSLFSYDRMGPECISPFLLLDHAGPFDFKPAKRPRGVGPHPHRGFETVTLVYEGELEHRDSSGSGGRIGEGDVQWMTAGSGIIHDEFHSQPFTEQGGKLEMVQLWVNLPAQHKGTSAAYQTLLAGDIPNVPLDDGNGSVRVVAGNYLGHNGPAKTFTPINMWDIRLASGGEVVLSVPEGHTSLLVVLNGAVLINDETIVRGESVVSFEHHDHELHLKANNETKLLLLSGEPIDEPVVGHGPFVMNSDEEIKQAITDFQSGKYGSLNG